MQDKGFHKQKGNKLLFTSPRDKRHNDVFKLQRDSGYTIGKASSLSGWQSTVINYRESLQSLHPWRPQCVGKITPKNDTCAASAPAPRGKWPPGIPPALLCDCTRLGAAHSDQSKEKNLKNPTVLHLLLSN